MNISKKLTISGILFLGIALGFYFIEIHFKLKIFI